MPTQNPALPAEISGVSFLNFKPRKAAGLHVTVHPCPFRRQHAVSRDAAAIARLDRLFAGQRARLRKSTGVPYFVDAHEAHINASILAIGKAAGLVDMAGF